VSAAPAPLAIAILGLNYAPEEIGIARYTTGMAEALAARGLTVEVVAGAPYYPQWQVYPGFGGWWRRAPENGVTLTRCPHYVPANPTGLRRIVHLASFALAALPAALGWGLRRRALRPRVVMAVAPALLSVPAFTAIRTLSRTAMNVLMRINFASQPRYTAATATGDSAARGRLVVMNLAISPLALPWVLVLALFGGAIIRIWTHGAVVADAMLVWVLAAIALINAIWMPLSNLVIALNRQGRFSYFYLGTALAALAVARLAARGAPALVGVRRIALVLLGQEAAMLVWVVALAASLGMLARRELAAGLAALRSLLGR
jgi:hypothetical protein